MEGFFETKKYQKDDPRKTGCHVCKASQDDKKMKVFGGGKKKILLIGDHPTKHEYQRNQYWIGDTGRLLRKTLSGIGIDVDEDCWSMNALSCFVNKPTSKQIDCCRSRITKVIKDLQPDVIILFGTGAVQSIIGNRWKKDLGTITKWRGWQIPDQEFNSWICPVMHPREIIVQKYAKEYLIVFEQDLQAAVSMTKQPFPHIKTEVKFISDEPVEQVKFLRKFIDEGKEFAFDYETTGLKPHADGHEIKILSLCNDFFISYSLIPQYKDKSVLKQLKRLFESNIPKIAQNMKYEYNWTYNILGIKIRNLVWDTMLVSHLLDNRDGVTGLKFQTYVQLGIIDYSSHISQYLKAKNSNGHNAIVKAMADPLIKMDLMRYCGDDSIYTYRIKKVQEKRLKKGIAFDLLHNATFALWQAEQNGFTVDVSYFEKTKNRLENRIKKLEQKLDIDPFIKEWKQKYGAKFTLGSGKQLSDMLYNVHGFTPSKYTEKGAPATDVETLEQLDLPAIKHMLNIRRWQKVKDTYISNFLIEQVDGKIHPFFNLSSVISYRSSSSNPNFQNIPKRDKEIMKIIRSGIKPRPGCHLVEMDFSKLEVSIAACYHKDPKMMEYLTSDHNDMHGDLAQQIFFVSDENWDKHDSNCSLLRAAAKNGFIFPQFYGDWYKANAEGLRQWVKLGIGKYRKGQGVSHPAGGTVADQFIANGIKSHKDFEEHMRKIENDFWNNRFRVYGQWKKKFWQKYQKTGVINFHTGFQARGIMRHNSCINYPVQGAAFHCLLWTFIQTHKLIQKEGLQTQLIGQIHDAIVMDVPAGELDYILRKIKHIATVDLPNTWKWINVPLQIEAEVCPVDASWAEKEDYEIT